jgi:hypothetical protein
MSVQVLCDQTVPRPVVMARPQELQFTDFIMPAGPSVRPSLWVPFAAIMNVLLPDPRSNSFLKCQRAPDCCGNEDVITGHRHRRRRKGRLHDLERCVTFGGGNVVAYLNLIFMFVLGGKCTLFNPVHIYKQTMHRTTQNKQYIEQHKN